jgi:hypothetical protein
VADPASAPKVSGEPPLPRLPGAIEEARAFFYAGAPSLVVSLWNVADAPTSRLVPAFYRAWLGGADKASALRTAHLALIRQLRSGRSPSPKINLVRSRAVVRSIRCRQLRRMVHGGKFRLCHWRLEASSARTRSSPPSVLAG